MAGHIIHVVMFLSVPWWGYCSFWIALVKECHSKTIRNKTLLLWEISSNCNKMQCCDVPLCRSTWKLNCHCLVDACKPFLCIKKRDVCLGEFHCFQYWNIYYDSFLFFQQATDSKLAKNGASFLDLYSGGCQARAKNSLDSQNNGRLITKIPTFIFWSTHLPDWRHLHLMAICTRITFCTNYETRCLLTSSFCAVSNLFVKIRTNDYIFEVVSFYGASIVFKNILFLKFEHDLFQHVVFARRVEQS